jgi:hypothetical protein
MAPPLAADGGESHQRWRVIPDISNVGYINEVDFCLEE